MTQPINLIFRFLQNKSRVQIWLYENTNTRIEGRIIVRFFLFSISRDDDRKVTTPTKSHILQGFDEYMNLTLDDAEELDIKKESRKKLGRILLKGDNITLMMNASNE